MPMMMLRHMIEKVGLSVARIEEVMAAPIWTRPGRCRPGRSPSTRGACAAL
ncbi:hypothetical protein ACTTAF_07670 [Rhodobacter capsulatus]|uniref:hypothetical protein n=1 Tax=Rhodobacter capsulatus TaxID=1061 RepID=UPI0040386EE6